MRIISILSALINCVLVILLIGLFRGLDQGLSEGSGFSIAGETGNQFLVRCYTLIGISQIVFVAGSFVNNNYISISLRTSSLMFTLLMYWRVYAQKSFVYGNPEAVSSIMNVSLPYDLAVVSLTLLLIGFQCIEFFRLKSSESSDFR